MIPFFSPPALPAVDIAPYRRGNAGIDYVTRLDSGLAGPHTLINALMHGNEICGAAAVHRLFRMGIRPHRGQLTLVFANPTAYRAFDPAHPYASRYVDEDMNRLWSVSILEGARSNHELRRARQLRPLYESADAVLDLHSMSTDSAPMILCGTTRRGRDLAGRLGFPGWVVADGGHAAGRRLIDHGPFSDPDGEKTAILVECGQHWRPETVDVAVQCCLRFLLALDMVDPIRFAAALTSEPQVQRVVQVTHAVTATTDHFAFVSPFTGMEVIPAAGTVIGHDGSVPLATPYDDCILIMPARRVHAGHTAVRLGRFAD